MGVCTRHRWNEESNEQSGGGSRWWVHRCQMRNKNVVVCYIYIYIMFGRVRLSVCRVREREREREEGELKICLIDLFDG